MNMSILNSLPLEKGRLNIIIAGGTCSGKTTLAKELKSELSDRYSVSVIEQDSYFKNLNECPRIKGGYLMDSINSFYIEEFRADVQKLFQNGEIMIPRYDISSNRRIAKDIPVVCSQINIFEGLHTISLLSDMEDCYKIFLNTSFDTCLASRIKRDMELYHTPKDVIVKLFDNGILPMYGHSILPQVLLADLVVKDIYGKGGDC